MIEFFRIWFIGVYILGLSYFLSSIYRFKKRRPAVEQSRGPLPSPPAIISWLIPPVVLLFEFGHLPVTWIPLRIIGFVLSIYAIVMMPWATQILGHAYTPGPALLKSHTFITSGPFRAVRHPIYSAVAALWLGVVLGTMNWVLLLLWPGIVIALNKNAKMEEELLRKKFGQQYDSYAKGMGRFIPKFRNVSPSAKSNF